MTQTPDFPPLLFSRPPTLPHVKFCSPDVELTYQLPLVSRACPPPRMCYAQAIRGLTDEEYLAGLDMDMEVRCLC
ncbi:hypothetical protein MLD38_030183 [Melastoma candidum]|uniref:Uncharacterized protein n=1 Tax=Melastoma candidum TaxID=119954 RepID=A0ACB9MMR7_9MYRT|nr:hypothetical protein MLD38_030183 [Melastoma candidum]